MTKAPTIETARKIEQLLSEVLELADGNRIVADTFKATMKVAMRNAVQNYYNNHGKEKGK